MKNEEYNLQKLDEKLIFYRRYENIEKHNATVKIYNDILNNYNQQFHLYDTNAKSYNKMVNEYNALLESSGRRWYVFPIPIGKTAAMH